MFLFSKSLSEVSVNNGLTKISSIFLGASQSGIEVNNFLFINFLVSSKTLKFIFVYFFLFLEKLYTIFLEKHILTC